MAEGQGLIVVGVDGSAPARHALDWALAEARLRGGRCLLVHAYDLTTEAASPVSGAAAVADAAQEVVDGELAFARESGVPVEGAVVVGAAPEVLLDAARDADLLVVGSRGRGGLASAVLGSVSTAVVHRAALPVVVVPSRPR